MYVLAFFPLFFYAGIFTYLQSARIVSKNPFINVIGAFLLSIYGFQHYMAFNTIYSTWTSVIFLAFLTISDDNGSIRRLAAKCVAMIVLIWSHPLSLAFAPLFLFKALLDRNRKSFVICVVLIASCALYHRFGIKPVQGETFSFERLCSICANTGRFITYALVPRLNVLSITALKPPVLAMIVAVALIMLAIFKRSVYDRKNILILLAILSLSMSYCFSRSFYKYGAFTPQHRYPYLPAVLMHLFFFRVLIGIAGDKFTTEFGKSDRRTILGCVLLPALILISVIQVTPSTTPNSTIKDLVSVLEILKGIRLRFRSQFCYRITVRLLSNWISP
jgi:hypothetical protein